MYESIDGSTELRRNDCFLPLLASLLGSTTTDKVKGSLSNAAKKFTKLSQTSAKNGVCRGYALAVLCGY